MTDESVDFGTPSARLGLESRAAFPTFLITSVTAVSFLQVFGSWNFLWSLIGVAAFVHACGIIVRTVRLPLVVSAIAPLVSVLMVIGWIRFRDTLWLGLPLSTTWNSMWSELREAWELIGDVITPVEFTSGFGTLAMFVTGLVAVVTDAFATRYGARAEVFVPSAATLFIVATVGTGQNRLGISVAWLISAILATTLIRRDRGRRLEITTNRVHVVSSSPWGARVRTTIGALVFAGLIGSVAAAVAPSLPGAQDEAWLTQRARGGARELKPFIDLRRQLTEPSPSVLFTVTADASAYWRISSLPDFDGTTWSITEELLDSAAGELSAPIGVDDPGVVSSENDQRFAIETLSGSLAPVAATPTRLRASTQSLFFEPRSSSLLVGDDGLQPGDEYEMVSTVLSPEPERLESATVNAPPSDEFLALPESEVVEQLRAIAASIAPPNSSPYQKALALQDYFRTQFTYSLDVPALSRSDATLEFLERRTGYCEHFSSTFAVFARTLGLPARVAIGFTPGDRATTDTGATLFTVRSIHAHAWPEVWFDGLGWVLFEPTPGRGAPNSAYTNVPEEQSVEPSPTTTIPSTTSTTSTPNDASSPTSSLVPADREPTDAPPSGRTTPRSALLVVLIAFLGIAWILLVPSVMQRIIGRRPDPALIVLWRRAVALYEFDRGPFPRSLSPSEIAKHATSRLYDDDPFICELAEVVTGLLFDGNESSPERTADLLARGNAYLASKRRQLDIGSRIRARFDPVAMWRLLGGSRRTRDSE